MTVKVTIDRGNGRFETVIGEVLKESTTFYFVQHGPDGEWFAKRSKYVNCFEQ